MNKIDNERIRSIRMALKMSQEEFAQGSGIASGRQSMGK
jgi:transcriptional regulator with XRE-family HTH domain